MITALVTGGTGFVGSHVARVLVARGYQVRILRRTTSRLDVVQDIDCEHFIGDVTDPASLRAAMEGVDWVFHVAAVADYWRSDPGADLRGQCRRHASTFCRPPRKWASSA